MNRFQEYCERKRQQYGDKFSPPTGGAFINAFNSGENFRIKVRTVYPSGETRERWGFVGITTGWSPVFLLMRNRRCWGSSDTLDPQRDTIIDCHWRG